MIDDMMAPKEPNTLDITCDVEKGYWPVRQLLADGYAAAAIYASSLAPMRGIAGSRRDCIRCFMGRENARQMALAAWRPGPLVLGGCWTPC